MPYNIINPGSIEDAWNNGSVMDMVNGQVAQKPTVQVAPQPEPEGVAQQSVQNLQQLTTQPNNSVFNQTHRAENPQPVPAQPTTQIANQGMSRRPTLNDYKAFALDYLTKKGYSYEDAMELMRPEFEIYAAREQEQNRAMADNLINEMQGMKIDSPEYRQAAFQLYRLDPKLGTFMLKEGIGPREQYLRGQKREDAEYANEMNFKNYLRKLGVQDERQQKAIADRIQQLVTYGGLDLQTATRMVMLGGGRNGRNALANTDNGLVSEKDYKLVMGRLKELQTKQDEGMLTNPNYRLSADEQDEFNRLSQIATLARQQLYNKYGIGQKQQQKVQINPNDYNSVGPFIQWAVAQNKGFTPELARAIRYKLGFNPDDNSPNNFVNQIFKTHYNFSG